MRLQGRLIIILFVEHKDTRVLRRTVKNIGTIARLFPHFWDRNAHDALKLLLLSSLDGQFGGESEHPALLGAVIKVCNGKLGTALNSKCIIRTDRVRSESVRCSIGRRCVPEVSPRLYVLGFPTDGNEREGDRHRLSSRDDNACTRCQSSQRWAPDCPSGTGWVECVCHAIPGDPDIKSAVCGRARRKLHVYQCYIGIMVRKRLQLCHGSGHGIPCAYILQGVDIA